MFTLIFVASLLFLITGCINETPNPAEPALSEENVIMYRMDGNMEDYKTFSIESLIANQGSLIANQGTKAISARLINPSANGHFTNPLGGNAHTFSIMQNNGGVNGAYIIKGGFIGEINMTSECIVVEGNRAVVSGQITKISGDNPFGLIVGDYMYFCHEDNGEGNNAPPDRSNAYFLKSSQNSGPICDLIPPSYWSIQLDEWVDVLDDSDQIQIK